MHNPGGAARPGTRISSYGAVLGLLTIEGQPSQVSAARAFVARTLRAGHLTVDSDAATLLTSEIVTNAIQHTKSGIAGGTVSISVIAVPGGVVVEVADDGSAGVPVVKGDLFAAEGHGLFMVQQLAAQWGYLRNQAGTTVWFHLPALGPPGRLRDDHGTSTARGDGSELGHGGRGFPRQDPSGARLSPAAYRAAAV